jgi:tRNA threonylcarbamoyladenosine biosynthesis protein TsaE
MDVISIKSTKELKAAASQFVKLIGDRKIFAFYGGMGAGKTTFIKAICEELGVDENITSPTFALVNEYNANGGKLIYHFDCYRLKDVREAYDFGAEEYFYSGNLCFVEWPEIIEQLLPDDAVEVKISVLPDESREVIINADFF